MERESERGQERESEKPAWRGQVEKLAQRRTYESESDSLWRPMRSWEKSSWQHIRIHRACRLFPARSYKNTLTTLLAGVATACQRTLWNSYARWKDEWVRVRSGMQSERSKCVIGKCKSWHKQCSAAVGCSNRSSLTLLSGKHALSNQEMCHS